MSQATGFARRQRFVWEVGRRKVALGDRTLIMGVLNVTPDSFSDGGEFFDTAAAVAHGLEMLRDGADIVDIGGESTRPGATPVSAEEELARVLPVIGALRREAPDALLSVDTSKAAVARAAVEAGADIVNDVSGFLWDGDMAATCAGLPCGVVLMHTRGRPGEWRTLPQLQTGTVAATVAAGLRDSLRIAQQAGVRAERIVIDPGFGFGKRGVSNYELLGDLRALHAPGRPMLAGVSRKSFLAETMRGLRRDAGEMNDCAGQGKPPMLAATVAATAAAILAGAHIVRVHDVPAALECCAVADAILHAV